MCSFLLVSPCSQALSMDREKEHIKSNNTHTRILPQSPTGNFKFQSAKTEKIPFESWFLWILKGIFSGFFVFASFCFGNFIYLLTVRSKASIILIFFPSITLYITKSFTSASHHLLQCKLQHVMQGHAPFHLFDITHCSVGSSQPIMKCTPSSPSFTSNPCVGSVAPLSF